MPFGIDEVDVSGAVNSSARDIEKTASEFFHLRALGENRRRLPRLDFWRAGRNRQPGEFALANLNVMGLIVDCVIEGNFAVAVAVEIAKSYVLRVCNVSRIVERLIAADNPIHVQVGEGDVARIANVERQSESAFAALLFGLQCVNLPVGGVVQNDFIANMMLA